MGCLNDFVGANLHQPTLGAPGEACFSSCLRDQQFLLSFLSLLTYGEGLGVIPLRLLYFATYQQDAGRIMLLLQVTMT